MSTITERLIEEGHTTSGGYCEKCWNAALLRAREMGTSQVDAYYVVMAEAESEKSDDGEPG